jgi:hypothetical protein
LRINERRVRSHRQAIDHECLARATTLEAELAAAVEAAL